MNSSSHVTFGKDNIPAKIETNWESNTKGCDQGCNVRAHCEGGHAYDTSFCKRMVKLMKKTNIEAEYFRSIYDMERKFNKAAIVAKTENDITDFK